MISSPDTELHSLVEGVWEQHKAARKENWLVSPSVPILFFGDLSSYRKAPVRVVTVALNPSNREFPEADPYFRFPGFTEKTSRTPAQYIAEMSSYFMVNPYASWFAFYEQALSGIGASYYGGAKGAALHTDIASCLATTPTWSRLPESVRERLMPQGIQLWHRLMIYLSPQIVLFSTARSWIDQIEFEPLSDWDATCSFSKTKDGNNRKHPLVVEARWYQVNSATTLFGFIPAMQKPLGGLSHTQKQEAGLRLLNYWKAGKLTTTSVAKGLS